MRVLHSRWRGLFGDVYMLSAFVPHYALHVYTRCALFNLLHIIIDMSVSSRCIFARIRYA